MVQCEGIVSLAMPCFFSIPISTGSYCCHFDVSMAVGITLKMDGSYNFLLSQKNVSWENIHVIFYFLQFSVTLKCQKMKKN